MVHFTYKSEVQTLVMRCEGFCEFGEDLRFNIRRMAAVSNAALCQKNLSAAEKFGF
jgi:hypothetical protein